MAASSIPWKSLAIGATTICASLLGFVYTNSVSHAEAMNAAVKAGTKELAETVQNQALTVQHYGERLAAVEAWVRTSDVRAARIESTVDRIENKVDQLRPR